MANRLVSVDDNLDLPPAVQARLTGNVRTEFTTYLNDAQAASSTAVAAASTASSASGTAQSAASTAQAARDQAVAIVTGDLDPANALLIDSPSSATRAALDEHYLSAGAAPANIINLSASSVPSNGTDASSALNALITAASPGDVIVGEPGKSYTLSNVVNITKPLTLRNINFLTASYTGTALRIQSSDVTLDGITCSGDTNGSTPVLTNYFVFVQGTSANRRQNIRITNCTMSNNLGSFIWAEWIEDFYISQNTLTDGQYAGIMVISGKRGQILNNTVRRLLMSSPLVNAYGISCSDLDNNEAARSEHVLIDGNYIEDVKTWAGIDTHSGNNIQIVNNRIWNCWVGINVVPGNSERLLAPKDCIVANNTVVRVDTAEQNAGIVFSGRSTGNLLTSGFYGGNVIRGYTTPYVTVATDPARFFTGGKAKAYGSSVVGVAGSGGNTQVPVTYPAGLFTAAPFVTVTVSSARVNTSVASNTATGCTLNLNNWTTAAANSVTVEWCAEER